MTKRRKKESGDHGTTAPSSASTPTLHGPSATATAMQTPPQSHYVAHTPNGIVEDPLIGLLVEGRYRIRSRLARGGMATVYIADDERLDRPVALKVMHPHLAESADFVARFRREARSAARIVHPGVVSVFDQGVIHGQGFLVMELVVGTDLRKLLHAQGAFTLSQALRYTQGILDALSAAHRVGVIHRDVKPENVLVSDEGSLRLTDFGLARAVSEVSKSTMGSLLGTVAYMAPEIATTAHIDARTDIYSVGVMLYEMLVGHVPWDGESPMQMAYSHVNDDIPLPSLSEAWIPREVDELVAVLAARDPAERPLNTKEALELVARARAALPANLAARRAQVVPSETAQPIGSTTTALDLSELTANIPEAKQLTSQGVVHSSGHVPTPGTPMKRKRGRNFTIAFILLLLTICGGAGGWWWWNEYGPGSFVEMPETVGRNAAAVESDLAATGLRFVSTEDFSDNVTKGLVISSEPEGATSVRKQTEVHLSVSKGQDLREIPQLMGMSDASAREALQDAGLAVGDVTTAYSDEVAEGIVISQSEKPMETILHDTPIDFVVSLGREPLIVPDLTGITEDEALKSLSDLGLAGSAVQAFSESVEKGRVVSQDVQAGGTRYKGDTVTFTVSKGPSQVEVPDVTGEQLDKAKKTLEDAGFTVTVDKVLGGIFNTVRMTNPAAGTLTKVGSTITVTII